MKRLLVSTALAATMGVSSMALAAATNANTNAPGNGNAATNASTKGNASGNANAANNANANNGEAIQTPKVISLSNWDYDHLYTKGWSAENFIDHADVYGPNGDDIGKVADLVIDPDGQVRSVIIKVGGFWKIHDTRASVPWNKVKLQGDHVVTPVTKDNVDQYNYFNYSGLPGSKMAYNDNDKNGSQRNDTAGAASSNEMSNNNGAAGNGHMTNNGAAQNNGNATNGQARSANNAAAGNNAAGMQQQATRPWRASELIGSYARLKGPNGNVNYGFVRDLIISNGKVVATVVNANNARGARGYYAYPYYGYGSPYGSFAGGWGWGWAPGSAYYNLPYNQQQVAQMPTFDYNKMKTQFTQG